MFRCSMSESVDVLDFDFHVFIYLEKENELKTVGSVFF